MENLEKFAGLGKVLDKLQKSGVGEALSKIKPTMQKCIVCGRWCPTTGLFTGEANQKMCEKCKVDYHHLAKIMCGKCHSFLGFMQAGINADGYHVKRDETLHTEFCPLCDSRRAKAEKTAEIIEIRRFKQIKRGNEMAGIIESGAHSGEIG